MSSILTKLISSLEIRTDLKSLRTFGFGLAIILSSFAGFMFWFEDTLHLWLPIAGILSTVLTLISPRLLLSIYYPWMVVTKLLGMLITYILITVTFYLIMMPIGFFLRLRRRDLLQQKWGGNSYWKDRDNSNDKRMNRMF